MDDPQKSLYVTHGDMLRICRIRRREHQDLPQYVVYFFLNFPLIRFLITNYQIVSPRPVTNLEFRIYDFFKQIFEFFFNSQTEKTTLFSINKTFFFTLFQLLKKLWTKLGKQIGENIWWIHKKLHWWPYFTIFSAHLLKRGLSKSYFFRTLLKVRKSQKQFY